MAAGHDLPSSSRALVPVSSCASEPHPHRIIQRPALFLAHLIAGSERLPQARERRKADASEVIAAYRETIERVRDRISRARR
jgi:hypothetical protein